MLSYHSVHPLYIIYAEFHLNSSINKNIQDGGHLGHILLSYSYTRPLLMVHTKFH